jgi:hypothetical protein
VAVSAVRASSHSDATRSPWLARARHIVFPATTTVGRVKRTASSAMSIRRVSPSPRSNSAEVERRAPIRLAEIRYRPGAGARKAYSPFSSVSTDAAGCASCLAPARSSDTRTPVTTTPDACSETAPRTTCAATRITGNTRGSNATSALRRFFIDTSCPIMRSTRRGNIPGQHMKQSRHAFGRASDRTSWVTLAESGRSRKPIQPSSSRLHLPFVRSPRRRRDHPISLSGGTMRFVRRQLAAAHPLDGSRHVASAAIHVGILALALARTAWTTMPSGSPPDLFPVRYTGLPQADPATQRPCGRQGRRATRRESGSALPAGPGGCGRIRSGYSSIHRRHVRRRREELDPGAAFHSCAL